MKGVVIYRPTRLHGCPLPLRFPWRRLDPGSRWRCECGQTWEVRELGWGAGPEWMKVMPEES